MIMSNNGSVKQTPFNHSKIRKMGSDNNWVNRGIENVRMPNSYIKIAYISVAAVGILGNLIVLIVRLKSTTMRKTCTNMLILNRSCVDFITSLLVILTITTWTLVTQLREMYSASCGSVICRCGPY